MAVLEWQREQDLLCPGCGHPRDETMDPEAQDRYDSKALRCFACAAKERAAEKFTKHERPNLAGLYFTVGRRDE